MRAIAALCLLACLLAIGGCSPLAVDRDVAQERLNQATPPLDQSCAVGQTFRASRPNLAAIEVLLVVYGDEPLGKEASLTLHLRTTPEAAEDLQQVRVTLAGRRHNDLLRFALAPLANSAGQDYYFCLESSAPGRVAVWRSTLDAYAGGSMFEAGQSQAGDLRFATFAQYMPSQAVQQVWDAFRGHLWPLAAALLLLYLPGSVLLRLLRPGRGEWIRQPVAHGILALCLSLALIPLFTLWASTLGIRLSPLRASVVLALLGAVELGFAWRAAPSAWRALRQRAPSPWAAGLALILALTLIVRLIQIRDVVLPLWVDSVHQTLITRLIAEQGAIPTSYEPLLPVSGFYRHFGFHALAAWYHWLSGLAIPQAILALGQILNAIAILPGYLLAVRLTGRPLAGLVAAAITGLISLMPAYYVSWGRYTQLEGMVLLPACLVLLYESLRSQDRRRHSALAAVAAAGLFVTHYRVMFFFVTFLVCLLLWAALARPRGWPTLRTLCCRTAQIALISALLVLPWLWNLLHELAQPLAALPVRPESGDEYNAIPWVFLRIGHSPALLKLAGAALVSWLARLAWRAARARSRVKGTASGDKAGPWQAVASSLGATLAEHPAPALVLGWVSLTALLVNLHLIGLPDIGAVNNASAVIALYLPLSLLAASVVSDALDWVTRAGPLLRKVTTAALGFAVLAWALVGARDMVTLINPSTVLATADDLRAMAWIRDHTSADARFLINTMPWQRGMFMGSDGGWWIPLLTDRQTTLPAVVYWGGAPDYVRQITELAQWASTTTSLDDAAAWEHLEQAGVTHVYIGARGGNIKPEMVYGKPGYELVYQVGPVYIFALDRAVR